MTRRGFSLAELLVAMVIAGIIGLALTRLVISQARFVSIQDGMMEARGTARAALNVLAEELRMVGDSGVIVASRDSIVVRAPYAHGVACGAVFGRRVVALLPTDSAVYAAAAISGFMWRDTLGAWRIYDGADVALSSTFFCSFSGVTNPTVVSMAATGWSARAVSVPNPSGLMVGAPVFLYQTITYRFAPSVEVPGSVALWRRVPSASFDEEMVAPFDTAAKFEFLIGDSLGIVTVPASPDSVRGVRVHLVARSTDAPAGRSAPVQFDLTTSLVFRARDP